MSTNLFPILQPKLAETAQELPLCREIMWDYERNRPVFRRGEPVVVEGQEAVLVWAWLALHTPRFRHEIFTRAYGCELESLVGQPYTEALKQAEARRYVRECLETNPYIKSVDGIEVAFGDGRLEVSCTLTTVYGKKEWKASV